MKDGWVLKNLGDVCDLQNGFAFKSKTYVAHSNTLNIRMSNIRPNGTFDPEHNIKYLPDSFADNYSQFLLKEGDLVIAMTDMAGDPKILGLPTLVKSHKGRRFLLNQRVGKLNDFSDNIFVPYLRYYLSSPEIKAYYKSKGAGGLQINISKKEILTADIPVPPLPEQKRIVVILDEAFAGISQAVANAEKNLANARELFESYLNNVFTQKGEGWVERLLQDAVEDTCSLSYGIVQPGKDVPDGLPVVRPTDLKVETICLEGLKRIDPSLADAYKRTTLLGGELLLCVRGSTGTVSIASMELIGANVTRGIVPIRFDTSKINQKFGYYQLISKIMQDQIKAGTYGAALMQINIRDLRKLTIVFPSLEYQDTLVQKLDILKTEIEHLETIYQQKLTALAELTQSLLQKAFAGELTAKPETRTREGISA